MTRSSRKLGRRQLTETKKSRILRQTCLITRRSSLIQRKSVINSSSSSRDSDNPTRILSRNAKFFKMVSRTI